MPVRRRVSATESNEVDPIDVFHWSDSGIDHLLDGNCYDTAVDARRGWEKVRRTIWAGHQRFALPGAATYHDGLTLKSHDFVMWHWNHLGRFELAGALTALAEDREHLAKFRLTRGARSISDFLDVFAADLDAVEATARDLASYPASAMRPYPAHLSTANTYGGGGGAAVAATESADEPEDAE